MTTGDAARAPEPLGPVFARLALQVFERGWLSSNSVLFHASGDVPATVVDTGYAAHEAQTLALVESGLATAGEGVGRIVNTHLHSDHCGGNAALQRRWNPLVYVPTGCFDAAARWDQKRLSFLATDQRCDRFRVDGALHPGTQLELGARSWEVHAAPGHDPTALMFFEPETGVLISGDALWEHRLAIIFPELVGHDGFGPCMRTLDAIERLSPGIVIPGHGRPFTDVKGALQASRERVERFRAAPERHRRHAVRALVMFHMLEQGRCPQTGLLDWLRSTPITGGLEQADAIDLVDGLVQDGVLREQGGVLFVP